MAYKLTVEAPIRTVLSGRTGLQDGSSALWVALADLQIFTGSRIRRAGGLAAGTHMADLAVRAGFRHEKRILGTTMGDQILFASCLTVGTLHGQTDAAWATTPALVAVRARSTHQTVAIGQIADKALRTVKRLST